MQRVSRAKLIVHAVVALLAAARCATAVASEAAELPVPKVVIYPGDAITHESLSIKAFNAQWASKMPIYKKLEDVAGRVARRTLMPGQPIPLNATRVIEAVSQGKTYRIVFQESGLVISGTAVALSSGAVGDLVSLRNPESGIVVRGVVHEDGTIRMGAK